MAVALMATASQYEAPAVRGLLYSHLARNPEIAAFIPVSGLRRVATSVEILTEADYGLPDLRH